MTNIFNISFRLRIGLAALILMLPASDTFPGSLDSTLNSYLVNYLAVKNQPSITAGFISGGKILWKGSAGYADVENNIPAADTTLYRIASVSKMITAAAVIQLADAGKLKLDEDARVYVPQFPKKKWKFTIRQILNHTSGLRTYRDGEFDSKTRFNSIAEVVQYLASDSLEYEPGTRYLYSSLSYTLLAAAIESVSGIEYTEYIRQNIFNRAGMSRSCFDYQQKIIKNRARGYDKNILRKLENTQMADLSIKFPGGGVLSTATDLLNFADALMTGKLFPTNWLDTMAAHSRLKNGTEQYYGLGAGSWLDDSKRQRIGHTGGGTGFSSQLTLLPKLKIAAVHIINSRDRILGNPTEDILAIALDRRQVQIKKSLADFLLDDYFKYGLDTMLGDFKKILKDSAAVFDTSIAEIKFCAGDLMNNNRNFEAGRFTAAAIEFTREREDLLILCGDAYLKDGNKGSALRFYKRALVLNPKNSELAKKINSIETKK